MNFQSCFKSLYRYEVTLTLKHETEVFSHEKPKLLIDYRMKILTIQYYNNNMLIFQNSFLKVQVSNFLSINLLTSIREYTIIRHS